jgi:hypothetical protein
MTVMAGSTPDDRAAQVAADAPGAATLDDVLRDAGFQITEAGRARWRERLATPIPAEALEEGQRMRDQARRHAA